MKTTTVAKGSKSAKSSSTSSNSLSKGSHIAKGSVIELENESNRHTLALHLEPEDNQRLTNLCGQFDQHLRQIEKHFDISVEVTAREMALELDSFIEQVIQPATYKLALP